MERTVIGDGTRVQHLTLHKTQVQTRWKHPNSKRQENFKVSLSAERVMETASRWTHTSWYNNRRERLLRHAVKTAGGYSLEET